MSQTRIRYNKLDTGILASKQYFTAQAGNDYAIYIGPDFSYKITNVMTGVNAIVGQAGSMHGAKIAAKKGLESLGYVFAIESRGDKAIV